MASSDLIFRLRLKIIPAFERIFHFFLFFYPRKAINWRFFLCSLPYELCVRFVDCLLLEGAKVKFRFALAFLNFCSSQGRCVIIDGSPDEVDDDLILQMIEDNPSDVEKILKKGFDIRNLQMALVKQLVNRHKMLLDLRAGLALSSNHFF